MRIKQAEAERHVLAVTVDNEAGILAKIAGLFTARGWGRRQARLHLERAWEETAGPELAAQTRLVDVRRGVMEIEVNNAVLLQELAAFQKRTLLEQLRRRLPNTTLNDLRFRAGTWEK